MISPFPGMDPFLEGYLWPDVHNRLANVIAELLAPLISPKYVARIELYTIEDTAPEEDVGIMYPDVEVLRQKRSDQLSQQKLPTENVAVISPVTISIPATKLIEVRIPVIEIRDREKNQLVTAIEILSPVNKRKPGLKPYREKRNNLHAAGVHLLEIDLIRRGTHPFVHPYLPKYHYMITLMRGHSNKTDVWGFDVQDALPVLPVPLLAPDADVPLDLSKALKIIYQRSLYHLSIDYTQQPPKPEFTIEEKNWMDTLLKAYHKESL